MPDTVPENRAFHAIMGLGGQKPPPVRVEREDDPNTPGRSAYRISGPSEAAVQDEIRKLMDSVDVAFGGVPGRAQFIGPRRIAGGYGALGEVVVFGTETAQA